MSGENEKPVDMEATEVPSAILDAEAVTSSENFFSDSIDSPDEPSLNSTFIDVSYQNCI